MKWIALIGDSCVILLAPALPTQAPTGSPSDVSCRLLAICDVVDACEGLSVEAVVAAAERQLTLSGPPGDHRLSRRKFRTETVSE